MQDVAAELVSHPTRPIKEIAERARYGSVHSFTHAFKEAFGASPAALWSAHREGSNMLFVDGSARWYKGPVPVSDGSVTLSLKRHDFRMIVME